MSLPRPAKAAGLQLISFAVTAIVLIALSRVYRLDDLLRSLDATIARHQPWSTLAYPLLHATCNLLLLPAGVLVVGSGFLFGLWQGFLLALTGHLLAATGAFWISRTFGRKFIERHLASRPQWQALDLAIAHKGWKVVFLSQLSPLFPTSLFNYCYGLTRLRYWPTIGWIALGWSPGMLLYAFLGRLGQVGWKSWSQGERPSSVQTLLLVGGLIATLAISMTLASVAYRLLREAREQSQPPALPRGTPPPAEPIAAGRSR
jgi:uncharacterized membrane protein YdjX (TVP38/TMEM64 family)